MMSSMFDYSFVERTQTCLVVWFGLGLRITSGIGLRRDRSRASVRGWVERCWLDLRAKRVCSIPWFGQSPQTSSVRIS